MGEYAIKLLNAYSGQFHIFTSVSAAWSSIIHLYQDETAGKEAPGLRLVPKLKYEHVYLTNFSKMRVDLAVQVGIPMRSLKL